MSRKTYFFYSILLICFLFFSETLISSDFTKLEPEVMVSGVALSLAEHLLEENPDSN